HSFITADPFTAVRAKGLLTQQLVDGDWIRIDADPLAHVRALLAPHGRPAMVDVPPFQGGAAGYVGYDWGAALERVPRPRYDDLALPDLLLGLYDWVIAWDHQSGRAWVISTGIAEKGAAQRGALLRLLGFRRPGGGELVPGALSADPAGRPGGDAPHQRHQAPRRGPRARCGPRPRPRREREGPGGERDDRRPAAERSVAGVPAGLGPGPRAVRARALCDGAPPRVDGRGRPRARARCRGSAARCVSRRLDHGRPESPGDADHRGARADRARRVLRC